MPTNLPPEYFDAEERYKAAATPEDQIARLEELISTVPKHKGTDHLRADLRRKLSRLRQTAQSKKKTSRHESAFHIDREGAGQVAVIGPPNVGKSSLVRALTNATPEVAPFPFTTWEPTPGMMTIDNIQIQLIDTPPLSAEYVEPELLNLLRRSDLALLMVDLQDFPLQQIEDVLALLEQNRIIPRDRADHYGASRPPLHLTTLIAVNKVDNTTWDEEFEVLCELLEGECNLLPLSVMAQRYFDLLEQALYDALEIMRVYAKPPRREPDLSAPFVLKRGSTVEEFAAKVHQDFVRNLQSARVWGQGVFDGQMVGREHILHEGDIVELRS